MSLTCKLRANYRLKWLSLSAVISSAVADNDCWLSTPQVPVNNAFADCGAPQLIPSAVKSALTSSSIMMSAGRRRFIVAGCTVGGLGHLQLAGAAFDV